MSEKENALLGVIIRDFTQTELDLKSAADYVDTLIPVETEPEFRETITELIFKLYTLKNSVEEFISHCSSYITEDSGGQSND